MTHVVSVFESLRHLFRHVSVVHRHEDGVDDDAYRDEHIDEGVRDEQLQDAGELVPTRAALPVEHQLAALLLQPLLSRHWLPILHLCRLKYWMVK